MTEPVGGTPIEQAGTSDPSSEITALKGQLSSATERLNKYDGERKDFSEQTNQINELKEQVEGLQSKLQEGENEDNKYLTVTQEELQNYKAGESKRFSDYNKAEADKVVSNQTEYQKYLGEESLSVKDEELFNEICKEHDFLVSNGGMPNSTGNLRADAKIAWRESENSLYRKKLQASGKVDFNDPSKVAKPVVPGQQELSHATNSVQATTMPDLPDDAKEFLALMGDSNSPDKVNKALGRL